uniref:Uncharacterized protein n=1 Tax=Anopheles arabiensis TaxID=7173 RepID=A0A182HWX6_ANOAR
MASRWNSVDTISSGSSALSFGRTGAISSTIAGLSIGRSGASGVAASPSVCWTSSTVSGAAAGCAVSSASTLTVSIVFDESSAGTAELNTISGDSSFTASLSIVAASLVGSLSLDDASDAACGASISVVALVSDSGASTSSCTIGSSSSTACTALISESAWCCVSFSSSTVADGSGSVGLFCWDSLLFGLHFLHLWGFFGCLRPRSGRLISLTFGVILYGLLARIAKLSVVHARLIHLAEDGTLGTDEAEPGMILATVENLSRCLPVACMGPGQLKISTPMARPKVADRPRQPGSSSDEDVRPHDHERRRHIGGRCHSSSSSSSFVAVVGILTSSPDRSSVFTSPKYVPREGCKESLAMQIYKAVVIVFLCEIGIVLSNGEEWQLPLSIQEEFNGELHRPNELNRNQLRLISESNNLSTDGYEVYPGQFPYHAIVNIKNDREASTTVTSGSLITPNYILTFLHKHENTYGFVELGYRYRADRERQQVIDFTRSGINIHPQFSGGSLNNIATIRLEHPVTLNRYVHPIRLPRLSDTRTFEMMEGTAPGRQYNGTMRYMRNQIMSNDDCLMNTQFICTNAYIGGAFCNPDRERQQVIDFTRSGINIQFAGGSLNNIATIRLQHPVTLNRYVQPIRLPRLSDTRTFEMMEGTSLGLEYNGTMRYLRNQIMSSNDCHTNTQLICTNANIGGLVVEDESGPILIGLTNLIYSCSLNNSILYMRLSLLRDWIANSSNYVFDF